VASPRLSHPACCVPARYVSGPRRGASRTAIGCRRSGAARIQGRRPVMSTVVGRAVQPALRAAGRTHETSVRTHRTGRSNARFMRSDLLILYCGRVCVIFWRPQGAEMRTAATPP